MRDDPCKYLWPEIFFYLKKFYSRYSKNQVLQIVVLGYSLTKVGVWVYASRCMETVWRPGIITRPRARASVCSSDRYSEQEPKMTLPSRSVHKNAPVTTRPSVILIRSNRFNHPRSFCFAADSSIGTLCKIYIDI